jgi:hypothetical protein
MDVHAEQASGEGYCSDEQSGKMHTVQRAQRFRVLAFCVLLFLGMTAALIVGDGNPLFSLAPAAGLGVFWGLLRLRLRVSVLLMLLGVLIGDYIADRPFDGYWASPLNFLGRLLYVNLNHLTPLPFLRFPSLDFLIVFLSGLAVYRKAYGKKVDPPPPPGARILNQALLVSFGTVIVYELWGIARGGALKQSLWQFHQLGFIPMLTFLLIFALRGAPDRKVIAQILVFGAVVKSLLGIYFVYFIAQPQGLVIEFATSHNDTFLYVSALLMALCVFIEEPTRKNLYRGLWYVPIVAWGLVVNDRRLAYVSLGGSVIMIYLFSAWTPLKKAFTRNVLLALPLVVLYVAAGWESDGRIFMPVQTFKSVLYGEQHVRGPDYRDLENFNLLMTWNRNPVMGSGFGHKFEEPLKLPDISAAMPDYQYQPHNTILWLWGVLGVFGYSGLFLYLVVAVYLAARSYRLSPHGQDRAAALLTIAIVIQYLIQCFGDMGTVSWMGVFFMAFALQDVSRMAVRVGAWPAPRKVQQAQPEPLSTTPGVVIPLPQPSSVQGTP